jgi:hypothetical protein
VPEATVKDPDTPMLTINLDIMGTNTARPQEHSDRIWQSRVRVLGGPGIPESLNARTLERS